MARFLACLAAFLLALLGRPPQAAAEAQRFWDFSPQELRLLIASPQVMVTRTAGGFDAYCRCPVILRPDEIPATMKAAIVAVEDKRYFDPGGAPSMTPRPGAKGGSTPAGARIPLPP